jgi:hypothetical protein
MGGTQMKSSGVRTLMHRSVPDRTGDSPGRTSPRNPGALKNLLDSTVGGGELYGKRVPWLEDAWRGRRSFSSGRDVPRATARADSQGDRPVHVARRDSAGRRIGLLSLEGTWKS